MAARPGLGNFRRVPDRLPVDAMVFLAPPPRFADFTDDEVTVIRHVAGGCTIASLRQKLVEGWPALQRALFAVRVDGHDVRDLTLASLRRAVGVVPSQVDWPSGRETNQRRIVVRGRTSPGALVSLGGERVQVARDGTFAHVLFLHEGQQRIEASARDVAGRKETVRSVPLILDTRAPRTEFDTRELWGKGRAPPTGGTK